jgi:uncharacterized membrane protein
MKKHLSLYVMAALYFLAGLNHFRSPASYEGIIPPWLGNREILNVLAGIAEIVLAVLILFKPTRKWACYGIIGMLIVFIPVHIYMIAEGLGINGKAIAPWVLWIRLLLLQPLLIFWAWSNRGK